MSSAPMFAALRIARRNAWRSKGRSALVMAMIGLPVLGMTAGAVLFRTSGVTPAERASRRMGQADAMLSAVSGAPVRQTDAVGDSWSEGTEGGQAATPTDPKPMSLQQLSRLLPPGARAVEYGDRAEVRISVDDRVVNAGARGIPQDDPITSGMLRLRRGRWAVNRGEAVLSPRLLRRTGLSVGDELTLSAPPAKLRIVGTVVDPDDLNGTYLLTAPSALGLPADQSFQWLVDVPSGYDAAALIATLNRRGILVMTRDAVLHPPPQRRTAIDAEVIGVTVVVVGMAALEIILLAGAAFAVGARRSRRELGLIAATGGTARHVRLVVLAGGVVLGIAAGVAGVPLGIVTAYLARPHVERLGGQLMGNLVVRPRDLLAIVAVGVVTAVLSAVLPARAAARDDVLAALTGRRGLVRTNHRITSLGVLAAAVGAAVAAYGARPPAKFNTVLAGSALAQLGFVATAPALVGLAGRLARWLPLAARFAVRDAARHRTRSGPAVGAVMAALAGSVALSVYLVSDQAHARRTYEPSLRPGQAWLGGGGSDELRPATIDAVAQELPTRKVVPIVPAVRLCGPDLRTCEGRSATLVQPDGGTGCESLPDGSQVCRGSGILTIGDSALVRAITGRDDKAATATLRQGGAVVFDAGLLRDGKARIDVETISNDSNAQPKFESVMVPAVLVQAPNGFRLPSGVLAPRLAKRLGVEGDIAREFLIDTTREPTEREIDRAQGQIERLGGDMYLMVERGFTDQVGLGLLALLAASAIVTFGASGIATGLALAESRPDMSTLAAVGAAPRVRRVLSMAQAGTIAGLGAGLGVLAGLVPAIAVISARDDFPLVIPWPTLGATVVVVPALAALCAGLFTRSRLPLERRIA